MARNFFERFLRLCTQANLKTSEREERTRYSNSPFTKRVRRWIYRDIRKLDKE